MKQQFPKKFDCIFKAFFCNLVDKYIRFFFVHFENLAQISKDPCGAATAAYVMTVNGSRNKLIFFCM